MKSMKLGSRRKVKKYTNMRILDIYGERLEYGHHDQYLGLLKHTHTTTTTTTTVSESGPSDPHQGRI